jgi:hypothetical protein
LPHEEQVENLHNGILDFLQDKLLFLFRNPLGSRGVKFHLGNVRDAGDVPPPVRIIKELTEDSQDVEYGFGGQMLRQLVDKILNMPFPEIPDAPILEKRDEVVAAI